MGISNLLFDQNKTKMVSQESALAGRAKPLNIDIYHHVNSAPLKGPYPDGCEILYLGMGCFWGAERLFWQLDGVFVTAVGYMGGYTPNPTYEETCSGQTGHTEAVMIVYDPTKISIDTLLKLFFEEHDPTQDMRQGNDVGSQYRSALYWTHEGQEKAIKQARDVYQTALNKAGRNTITTELNKAGPFYFAETYHQQYLAKNPNGYCGLKGTGVACVIS